ncbi:MAG TPA: HIT family protein [Nitrososphaeraceae archaeon]|nr:HIT family protein [Nitrososphaeraceae archaeon]
MSLKTKCIFCSIINNELIAVKIFENSTFIAFMDKYPINKGHALVLPKNHHESIFTMDDDEVGKLFSTVSFLAKGIVKALDAKGLNIGQNNGKAANQIVPHVHVHIIPRYSYDSSNGRWPSRNLISDEELERIAEKIRATLTVNGIKAS